MSMLVVECFIMAINPIVLAYASLDDGEPGITITGDTREELAVSLRSALKQMKPKVKEDMLLSEVLEQLEKLKQEYASIASQYGQVYYEDTAVYFGSTMWYDAYAQDLYSANPYDRSIEDLEKDYKRATKIVDEANKLFKQHNLDQFLLERDASYWLGVLPEPYTSVY